MKILHEILETWEQIIKQGKWISVEYDIDSQKNVNIRLFHYDNFEYTTFKPKNTLFKEYSENHNPDSDDGNLLDCLQYLQNIQQIAEPDKSEIPQTAFDTMQDTINTKESVLGGRADGDEFNDDYFERRKSNE